MTLAIAKATQTQEQDELYITEPTMQDMGHHHSSKCRVNEQIAHPAKAKTKENSRNLFFKMEHRYWQFSTFTFVYIEHSKTVVFISFPGNKS